MMKRTILGLVFASTMGLTGAFSAKPNRSDFISSLQGKTAAVAGIVAANIPTLAQAVEDDYEYGKVDAPIGLAVGAGLLAIITAAVPVLLSPGEEAFEEIRSREESTFGKKNSDVLKKKK